MITLLPVMLFICLYALSINGGRPGRRFFISAVAVHAIYVIYRWYFLGWIPVTERFDILLVMAFVVAGGYFYFRKIFPDQDMLAVFAGVIAFLSIMAIFQGRMDTIDPSMESVWFFAYSIFFIAGFSLFTISAAAGILNIKTGADGFERLQYRTSLFGWLLFSFALVSGSFWFYLTYGTYWLWTAKELWITIVWFYYSFYLHGRMIRGLAGRPSVIIGMAGLPVLLFTYLGVTPILGSPWSQF